MKIFMRRLLMLFVMVLLFGAGATAFFLVMAVESHPVVARGRVPRVDDALRAREMGRNVLQVLNGSEKTAVLEFSETELESLMALGGRGVSRFSGKASISTAGMILGLSYRLPAPFPNSFVNLQMELPAGEKDLKKCRFLLGRLTIPGWLAHSLLVNSLDLALGKAQGRALMDSMDALEVSKGHIVIHLRDVTLLGERLKNLKSRLSQIRETVQPVQASWDIQRVREYYRLLTDRFSRKNGTSPVLLADCLGELFTQAGRNSRESDPVRENQAAIMALAVYLGGANFEPLVGPVSSSDPGKAVDPPPPQVILAGRQDLALHFVYSAGLKLLTDQGITLAIGEIKEMLDAGAGGSGFSFVDLAADRAGARFAALAAESRPKARNLQILVSGSFQEQLFFPFVKDLPEGLTQAQFERDFGGVDGRGYVDMVSEIDGRIDRLPAFVLRP